MVGIDASGLIRMKGALRCITMNVPSGRPLTAESLRGVTFDELERILEDRMVDRSARRSEEIDDLAGGNQDE